MWKNAFQKCEKVWKNVEKNAKQEITGLNTFPNLNLKKYIYCEPIDMNHWKWIYAYVESLSSIFYMI